MGTYKGLLVRDAFNDTGTTPSPEVAPTASPDVICYQMGTLSPSDAAIKYDKDICKSFMQDLPNNIYIRAKNISDGTLAGKVKAFYAPLNLLYMPPQWVPIKDLTQTKTELELVDSSYKGGSYAGIAKGAVGVNREAFVLNKVENPDLHHCMMGLCTSPDGTFLTLPSKFENGNNSLWWFLRNHPEIAYHNMVIKQPFSHTVTLPVSIGNHDADMRRFIMNVSILKGVETLKGATLLMQSTDAECAFTHQLELDGKNTQYGCDAKVPAAYQGVMNFSVIMPDYDHVDAVLHVQNLAVDQSGDQMTPDAALHFLSDGSTQTGTLLGDFHVYLGANYDNANIMPSVRPSGIQPLELPTLDIHREM